ncbi:hypothetical protein DYB32_004138 [Aphanomyces invadans]|uniref:Gfo/Idh/MocA-like oxidoreductase C-terminal domain-containing protein n=1 Tax=Aphanomyces invadans TaxID=157072 RepID=A0A418AYI7_9STRA|nr:hypothetical protein DYB32_004138 [Aphanomyces invadans]
MHYVQAKLALQAKKHVVVDKPFCVTHAEATELVSLAAAQGVMLSVFHNRRWDSDFLTVQDLVRRDALGHVRYAEIHFDRYRPEPKHNWKEDPAVAGGGLLYDLGSHLVDQMLVLFGPPATIQCMLRFSASSYPQLVLSVGTVETQRDYGNNVGTDDYFCLTCQYDDGLVVVLTASMLVKELGPKFILRGTKGTFEKYGLDTQEASLRSGNSVRGPTFGEEDETMWGTWTEGPYAGNRVPSLRGNYVEFYQGVADAMKHGTPAPVLAEDAARVIQIVEHAKMTSHKRLDVAA